MNVNFVNIIYQFFYKNVVCEANIEEVKLMSSKHKGLKNVISRSVRFIQLSENLTTGLRPRPESGF